MLKFADYSLTSGGFNRTGPLAKLSIDYLFRLLRNPRPEVELKGFSRLFLFLQMLKFPFFRLAVANQLVFRSMSPRIRF